MYRKQRNSFTKKGKKSSKTNGLTCSPEGGGTNERRLKKGGEKKGQPTKQKKFLA